MVESTSIETSATAARRFKALGDPTRLRIVQILAGGTHCVCELQGQLDVAANVLSHHLKTLREAGLVRAERRGRWIDYELDPATLAAVAEAIPEPQGPREASAGACGTTRPESVP